jgi:hypothetical protein
VAWGFPQKVLDALNALPRTEGDDGDLTEGLGKVSSMILGAASDFASPGIAAIAALAGTYVGGRNLVVVPNQVVPEQLVEASNWRAMAEGAVLSVIVVAIKPAGELATSL